VDRDSSVGIAAVRGSNPGEREILRTRLHRPSSHLASYKMGTGSFPAVKRRGVALTTHTHLAPRLKKEQSYTCTPLCAFKASYEVN
jgi:hypothetical protein